MSPAAPPRFRAWPWRRKAAALEAAAALVAARVALACLPFGWLVRWAGAVQPGGEGQGTSAPGAPAAPDGPLPAKARGVGAMIPWAAARLPVHANCMVQALAGLAMLRRRGIPGRLVLGLRRDDPAAGLEAHAWVEVRGQVLIGAETDRPYRAVARAGPPDPPGGVR